MKITLEFTDIEKFFTELPRFAALMNFSGEFASFDHVKKSELLSCLKEPDLPEVLRNDDGSSRVRGTQEQLDKVNEAGEIADKTVEMVEKKKKAAKAQKTPATPSQEAAQTSEEAQTVNTTPEAAKAAQAATESPDGGVKDTDVRKVFNKLMKSGHRDDVKKIFKHFGASNFSGLDKKDFAAAIEMANKVLEKGGNENAED